MDHDRPPADPLARFREWFTATIAAEPRVPDACALATADRHGVPSVRMVLLKAFDARGFVFYTNLGSRKSRDLRENPHAALCFHWKSLARQVRIEGRVEPVSDAEADAYFASRPRESRIGAWASQQSEPLAARQLLEDEYLRYAEQFGEADIPRPPFWGGYRLVPARIEFWEDVAHRLHHREEYLREGEGWIARLLYP